MVMSRRRRTLIVKLVCLTLTIYAVYAFIAMETEQQGSEESMDNIEIIPADQDVPVLEEALQQDLDVNVQDQQQEDEGHGEDDAKNVQEQQQQHVEDEKNEEKNKEAEENGKVLDLKDQGQGEKNEDPEDSDDPAVPPPPQNNEGYGDMGKAVIIRNPDPETKAKIDQGWKEHAYNRYVSDLIALDRSLPDLRGDWCKEPERYQKNLPKTSVIIIFHNEGMSALMRSVYSIHNRSPPKLLKEVILVDDGSTMEHLKEELENYLKQFPKVRLIRSPIRIGLIKARLLGAEHARAPVLTFLDSHIECTEGWMEPLLDRIALDPTNVVCPVIDVISDENLAYQGGSHYAVGGFDWNLQFNWHGVPKHERDRHKNFWEPVWSPTMAGGLFAIDKDNFERLGKYDPEFEIWGGENLELSFKTWMCGGTLEIVPCSHVGHIFRKRSPYSWGSGNVLRKNSVRLAEVWLDEYKQYYYDRIGNNLGNFGDIGERKELREKLGCKSFKWYLDNIFPELFIPGEAVARGSLSNPGSKKCVDSAAKPADMHKPMVMFPCHGMGGNQFWMLSKGGEIRRDEACLDFGGAEVILYPCHGDKGNQWWKYDHDKHQLVHALTKKCLGVTQDHNKLEVKDCDPENKNQEWVFEKYNATAAQETF